MKGRADSALTPSPAWLLDVEVACQVETTDKGGTADVPESPHGPAATRVLLRLAAGPGPSSAQIDAVADASDEWEAQIGEVLIAAGHRAPQGFVVLSGSVSLIAAGRPIARLGPGAGIWPTVDAPMPVGAVAEERSWLLLVAPAEMALLGRA